jgi:hypothetical protein
MTVKNLTYFINSWNILFSKAFLYSQAKATNVFKDSFFNLFNNFKTSKTFVSIVGSSNSEVPIFDVNRSAKRGNSVAQNSMSYNTEDVDLVFKDIISNNLAVIENYLGKGFLYEPPLFFRNCHIPEDYQNYDIYSNVWHQDSHDGDMLLKIFVLLMDVKETDGPFTYLERSMTKKYWQELRDRWTFSKFKKIPRFNEEKRVVGKKGDYLIVNTANCVHMATIPADYRDMAQIALYPKWRKTDERKSYKLDTAVE